MALSTSMPNQLGGLGGLGSNLNDQARQYDIYQQQQNDQYWRRMMGLAQSYNDQPAAPKRNKSFREELQAETDAWLK